MSVIQQFASIVVVVQNRSPYLRQVAADLGQTVKTIASEYELIFVDNGSSDDSVAVLESLTGDLGLPNIQVYALNQRVSIDAARWAGCEQALGDVIVIFDPWRDARLMLPKMVRATEQGCDVVFAQNKAPRRKKNSLSYRTLSRVCMPFYRYLGGMDLERKAPPFRAVSRQVVKFLMQHPNPSISYRYLPATAGFSKKYFVYSDDTLEDEEKKIIESIDRAAKLLVSTTGAPLRAVNGLCLFGATANVLYSIYVVGVATLKAHVAPGWVSMSLQQSGMFILLSLVLLVLGEYILYVAAQSSRAPTHYVRHEYTSNFITSREKLNIDDISLSMRGNISSYRGQRDAEA